MCLAVQAPVKALDSGIERALDQPCSDPVLVFSTYSLMILTYNSMTMWAIWYWICISCYRYTQRSVAAMEEKDFQVMGMNPMRYRAPSRSLLL
jgi:hypothetical protein